MWMDIRASHHAAFIFKNLKQSKENIAPSYFSNCLDLTNTRNKK